MIDWQTFLALTIVAAAARFVLLKFAQFAKGEGKSGCSGCPSKQSLDNIKSLPLVQIGSAARDRNKH